MPRFVVLLFLFGCNAPYRTLAIQGEWLEKPYALELCDELNVDHERVLEQVNWWHYELNEDYPEFTWDDVIYSDCQELPESGVIRVRKSPFGEVISDAASAWTIWEWEAAVIESPPGSFNVVTYIDACTIYIGKLNTNWVIRHEFGHCFGWGHTVADQWSHVMSPWVGRDSEGLEEVPSENW